MVIGLGPGDSSGGQRYSSVAGVVTRGGDTIWVELSTLVGRLPLNTTSVPFPAITVYVWLMGEYTYKKLTTSVYFKPPKTLNI